MPATEPTNSTAAPLALRLSATQSAGIVCPPVPPPATKTRGASPVRRSLSRLGHTCSLTILRYTVEDTHGGETDDHARTAIADEREGHPGQRDGAHGRPDIEGHLDGEHRGEPCRQTTSHHRGSVQRDLEPCKREEGEGRDHGHHTQEPQLLPDEGEDHVGLCLGDGDASLPRPSPNTQEAASFDGDHGLYDLVPGALRDGPRVEERQKTGAPVWLHA